MLRPPANVSSAISRKQRVATDWRDFLTSARQIGRNLAQTLAKLEKLTLLAKKKSLFEDRSGEIERLIDIIRQDTASLNKQIGRLQELARTQRVSMATPSSHNHLETHSKSVVVGLQTKLARMSNDFKDVLEVRTASMIQQQQRRQQFSHSGSLGNSEFAVNQQNSILISEASSLAPSAATSSAASNDHASSSDVRLDMNGTGEARHRFPGAAGGNQQQQTLLIDHQDTYLEERADTMQQIESTIVELGGIFQQLAGMIQEQVTKAKEFLGAVHYFCAVRKNISPSLWDVIYARPPHPTPA